MSKIYEALQQAKKERKDVVSSSETLSPEVLPASSYPDSHALTMEKEMIDLFQKIESLLSGRPQKAIQFIGSREGEGTSTIVQEYATLCAVKLHKTVLILDTDHYKPGKYYSFSTFPEFGWDDAVKDRELIGKALHKIGDSSLYVSCMSECSKETAQIFDKNAIKGFLEELKQKFDLVLIDSSPADNSHDWVSLSQGIDGVIMVLEAEKTRWPVAENLRDKIVENGGKILGVVFNKRRYYIPDFIYKRL